MAVQPDFHMIDNAGVRLRVAVMGDGPLVLLVHGFPESGYSWRHQIAPLAAAGFKACALDVRGYGGSDRPLAVEAYRLEALIDDLVAIRTALAPNGPAVLVGHDWGAPIIWNAALMRPDRFDAACGMSVAYLGVADRPSTDIFHERFTQRDRFFYQAYFQQQGVAEAELEPDLRGFLRKFYYALSGDAPDGTFPTRKRAGAGLLDGMIDPPAAMPWLSDADLDRYVAEFAVSGLRGPLNRYRNYERDFDLQKRYRGTPITQPALFICGSRDMAFSLSGQADPIGIMRTHVPKLRDAHILPGCGHWTQQERPDDVTRLLIQWLRQLDLPVA